MPPTNSTVESIANSSDAAPTKGKLGPQGPPPAKPKPRSAADSSLFSSVGKSAMQSGQAGLGAEGSSPQIMGQQGLAMIQRGVQILNLSFPENPGLVAVLTDLMGRLQAILPQLTGQNPLASQGGGMFPQQQQMGMQQQGGPMQGPPGPPMGAPPMAGPPGMPPSQ